MKVRSASATFELSRDAIAHRTLGQSEVVVPKGLCCGVAVSSPFSRFGNNFYQLANSAIVASRLGIMTLHVPDLAFVEPDAAPRRDELSVLRHDAAMLGEGTLSASFYLPAGFDTLFDDVSGPALAQTLRPVTERCYRGLLERAENEKERAVVAHFRGGDIFSNAPHPWYVQPPAAYYIEAISHAMATASFARVDLVAEDLTNPAIIHVERFVKQAGWPYRMECRSLDADIVGLLSASCLIASHGTFPEAAALISRRIERFYSFRTHASQMGFEPFVQSRVGSLLKAHSVATFIVEDTIFHYTPQKTWANSEAQRWLIEAFERNKLRLYRSNY